jgi:hypothetical protein
MTLSRRPARLTAWIAIFAVLLAALAPGLARAFASSQQSSTPWAEVCTAAGLQVRQALAPTSDSGEHEGAKSRHCPFCLNHAGHFVLPTTPLDFSPAIDAGAVLFYSAVVAHSPRFACSSPQSRAPPVRS